MCAPLPECLANIYNKKLLHNMVSNHQVYNRYSSNIMFIYRFPFLSSCLSFFFCFPCLLFFFFFFVVLVCFFFFFFFACCNDNPTTYKKIQTKSKNSTRLRLRIKRFLLNVMVNKYYGNQHHNLRKIKVKHGVNFHFY